MKNRSQRNPKEGYNTENIGRSIEWETMQFLGGKKNNHETMKK